MTQQELLNKAIVILFVLILSGCVVRHESQEKIQEYLKKAQDMIDHGDWMQGEMNARNAIDLAENIYDGESKELAEIYLEAGNYMRIFDDGLKTMKMAETIYIKCQDSKGLAQVYYRYARKYGLAGQKKAGLEYLQKALEYCDKVGEDADKIRCNIYIWRAIYKDDYEDSLEDLKEAEKILDQMSEESDAEVRFLLYKSLGECYFEAVQNEAAIENYTKAIQEEESLKTDKEKIQLANCYGDQGYSYAKLGEYAKGIEGLERELQILETIPDVDLWDYALVYCRLALIYASKGLCEYEKSMDYAGECLRLYVLNGELTSQELDELMQFKEVLKNLYESSPFAEHQDFDSWYRENVKNYKNSNICIP